MDFKQLILVAFIGFLGTTIRRIPTMVVDLLVYLYGYRVRTTSEDTRSYNNVNEWLLGNVDSKALRNKKTIQSIWVNGDRVSMDKVGLGKYICFQDNTIIRISSSLLETRGDNQLKYELVVETFGKRDKEIRDTLLECMEANVIGDYVYVEIDYEEKIIPKRSCSNIIMKKEDKDSITNFKNVFIILFLFYS